MLPTSMLRVLQVALVVSAIGGCSGPRATSAPDDSVTGCQHVLQDIAAEEPALPDREAAWSAFVQDNPALHDAQLEEEGNILLSGERIGRAQLDSAPAGGVYVAEADWCLPQHS